MNCWVMGPIKKKKKLLGNGLVWKVIVYTVGKVPPVLSMFHSIGLFIMIA